MQWKVKISIYLLSVASWWCVYWNNTFVSEVKTQLLNKQNKSRLNSKKTDSGSSQHQTSMTSVTLLQFKLQYMYLLVNVLILLVAVSFNVQCLTPIKVHLGKLCRHSLSPGGLWAFRLSLLGNFENTTWTHCENNLHLISCTKTSKH